MHYPNSRAYVFGDRTDLCFGHKYTRAALKEKERTVCTIAHTLWKMKAGCTVHDQAILSNCPAPPSNALRVVS